MKRLWSIVMVGWALSVAAACAGSREALHRRAAQACAEVLLEGRHSGVAWLVSKDGLMVTAAHLFDGPDVAVGEVVFGDNERARVRRVALDRGHDLALLQLDPRPANVRERQPLVLARRDPVVGDEVFQFGAPIFRSEILQPGHVASPSRAFEFQSAVVDYAEVVPVAAMMQGGTSGGPWMDRRGRVVGVQSSVMSLEGRPVGVAFMAPLGAVRKLVGARRDAATPTLGLGVDELWQQSKDYLARLPANASGLVASVVREGGPAAAAGVQVQDLLVRFDGRPLMRIGDLVRETRRQRPGDRVELAVIRSGESGVRRVQVVVGQVEERMKP